MDIKLECYMKKGNDFVSKKRKMEKSKTKLGKKDINERLLMTNTISIYEKLQVMKNLQLKKEVSPVQIKRVNK